MRIRRVKNPLLVITCIVGVTVSSFALKQTNPDSEKYDKTTVIYLHVSICLTEGRTGVITQVWRLINLLLVCNKNRTNDLDLYFSF